MYELIQAGEKTYYIDCPAKIGIYRVSGDEVCLIDSGNDKNAGKKALRILEEQGWKLKMILNTHFHADHIGGNESFSREPAALFTAGEATGCSPNVPFWNRRFSLEPIPLRNCGTRR